MKSTSLVTVLLILGATLCLSGESQETVISGTIFHAVKPTVSIDGMPIQLNDEGQFTYRIHNNKPTYFEFNFGKQIYLFLHPGDHINLIVDARKDITSIVLSGDRVAVNRFLLQEESKSVSINRYFNQSFRDLVSMEEEAYAEQINALWEPFEDRFRIFIKEKQIDDVVFIRAQEAVLAYSKAGILIRYPSWHRTIGGTQDYVPSEQFLSFLSSLDLNDNRLIDIQEYREFLDHFVTYKTESFIFGQQEFDYPNYSQFRAKIDIIQRHFKNPEIRTEMLYPLMKSLLSEYYHKGIDDLIGMFRNQCTNNNYLDELEVLIEADREVREQCDIKTYKTVDDIELDVFIYLPDNLKEGEKRPAVAFFHGGGWALGKPEWGHWQCKQFAARGLAAFSFEYRLIEQHGTTPLECVTDGRSAIRWLRKHADELNIDTNRIVGSGFSAGGHIALCTTMIDKFDDPEDNISIKPELNAFLLWVTPAKIYDDMKSRLKGMAEVAEIDPMRHIRSDLPPMIFFQGTNDDQVPPESVKSFVKKMQAAGNRCELHVYEGQTHLNWGENSEDVFNKMVDFLKSIEYLP